MAEQEELGEDARISDVSEIEPRRLRYSEEVLPLHWSDAVQPGKVYRPLKVYARIKPVVGGAATQEGGVGSGAGAAAGDGPQQLLQATYTEISQVLRCGGNSMAYSFTRVFEGSNQEDFYGTAIEPLLEELVGLRTGSSVFMAYGASGTGKSYTMQGTSAQPGMVPRTLSRLYQLLEERGKDHQVQLCFYEVYENRVYDLLQSARLGKRQAQHLPIQVLGANCCVPGLLRCHCTSADAGQRLYAAASRIRTQSATQTNSESSRSHAVFTIQLLEVEKAAVTGRSATLSLVDLAGAERAGRTKNVGSKLRESANINTSLSVLGRCLEALRHNQALAARGLGSGGAPRVIPVRESSLTSLFKGVLTGQGNLVLSVHLSQHGDEYDTNRHTLRFGALASRLQMAVSAPTAAAAAALPPLPPSNHHQQQSGQGRAKRQRTQPAFEQQPPIAEAPEEEGMEEELEAGALQQEAATQEEEGARAADASNAPAGEQTGPEAEGDGADAALVELLRARVQQLQQQLVVAEETARAAAVAEWEELVASGRDELEEAQQRAEQLEEQLAAMGKELVAAQREAAAVRKELSQERAARKYREEALEKELAELRAATGSSQAPATGQARPAAARAEQRQAADRQQPDAEPQAEGADAPGTSGRQAEDRAPLAARPPSGNKQQPDQPGAGAHVGRTGATGGGSTGRPAGGRKRAAAAAAAAAAEGASCGAPVVGGTSATGTAGPSRQVTGRHGNTGDKVDAAGPRSKRRRGTDDGEVDTAEEEQQAHTAGRGGEEPGTGGGARGHAGQGQVEVGAGDGAADDGVATADAGKTPVAGRTRRKRQAVRQR